MKPVSGSDELGYDTYDPETCCGHWIYADVSPFTYKRRHDGTIVMDDPGPARPVTDDMVVARPFYYSKLACPVCHH